MKKTAKRLLALGMTLSIAVGMFPVTALAADGMPDSYDFRGKTAEQVGAAWETFGPDPNLWSVDSNGLTLKTHDGDIYTNKTTAKNIFYQETIANGAWVAETKITLGDDFDDNFQQGAILAYDDNDNYVKFSYEYNNGNMFLQLASEVGGAIQSFHSTDLNEKSAGTFVYLQLIKDGNNYSAKYSTNGVTFEDVLNTSGDDYFTNAMANPKLAITANNGADASTANKSVTFAYVAAMTKAQAESLEALETAIVGLPTDASAVTSTNFEAIDAAAAQYAALSHELKGTLVNQSAHLADLVARVADMRAAADVVDKITAIGTVTLESEAAIIAAKDAYNTLTPDQKALITAEQLKVLTDAEAAYNALANEADFLAKVAAIGTIINLSSEEDITAAKTAYNALNETQKAEVSSEYAALTIAETVLAVVKKIAAIDATITLSSEEEITAARTAFSALSTSTLMNRVGNAADLTNAEAALNVVKKINAIDASVTLSSKDKIAAARAAFDLLTTAQKGKLNSATTLLLLNAEADYVKALIADIGTVTLDSKTKIEVARAAYNKLDSNQKTRVGSTDLTTLQNAEAALADLTAAAAVDAKIDAIGTVEATTACKAKIDAARTAYDDLTTAQKALVKKYDDLTNAEQLYALLAALEGPCDGGVNCPAHVFTDVNPALWYHAAVDYALTEGLFKGVSTTQFAPNGTMTRAMIWTVLARMDDANLSVTDPWYKSAQNWAVNNQVSDGTTPDGSVTREQLVTMLWRFMDEPDANGTLGYYPDSNKVSSWAKEAMTWAVANGVVSGVANPNGTITLDPGATATRAQVAQMLMNFLNK